MFIPKAIMWLIMFFPFRSMAFPTTWLCRFVVITVGERGHRWSFAFVNRGLYLLCYVCYEQLIKHHDRIWVLLKTCSMGNRGSIPRCQMSLPRKHVLRLRLCSCFLTFHWWTAYSDWSNYYPAKLESSYWPSLLINIKYYFVILKTCNSSSTYAFGKTNTFV